MLEKGKINPGEFQIIVASFTIGSAILVAPAPMSVSAKQDAWLAAILTVLMTLFFVFIFNQVTALYPSMTYVEYSEKILGKGLGKIAVFPYLFYIFQITCGQVRDLGDFLTTEILAETPIQMIMIIFTITGLIGVRAGLEVICRSAVIFFPWIFMLFSLLFLFLIPQIKFENIQPIMANGLKPILRGSYPSWANTLQLGILFMIMPYVMNKAEMKKAFYWGYFIGGLLLTILITMSTLVLGADLTARQSYPSYMLGKKFKLGLFYKGLK